MKRSFKIFMGSLLLLTLSFLAWKIYSKLVSKRYAIEQLNRLPDFSLIDPRNGQPVGTKNVVERPLWLVFFYSTCDYCQMEADNIRNAPELAKLDIWLVSSESADTLIAFGKRFGLDTLHHVKILYDHNHETFTIFNVASAPASFLYHPEGHLIQSYKGLVRPETVYRDAGIN